ncbi:MAG: hypothetical protein V3U88_03425 [Methylococcales bacterium]
MFRRKSVPSGTWIFTDHERLSGLQLRRAAQIATCLKNGGARVLNHPALVRSRYEILRRFEEAGINQFSVLRCDSNPEPSRFPVFVRNSYDHNSTKIALIDCQKDLDAAIQEMERCGISLDGKLVIVYSSEELIPGVWTRLSSYCIAGQVIAHHMAFDDSWIVKDGFDKERLEAHPYKEHFVALEREFVCNNGYNDVLEKAFAIARIDYGRADCSIVNNQLQIYEINTNPNHGNEQQVLEGAHPDRRATQKLSEDKLQAMIANLNTASGDDILIGERWLKTIARPYWRRIRGVFR